MRKIQLLILSAILLQSCCDSDQLNDYDHAYDKYLPPHGQVNIDLFYTSDTSKVESIEVVSDLTETLVLKVNGDGCTENFIQRSVKLDLPMTVESDFTLSVGGQSDNLSLRVYYNALTAKNSSLGYAWYDDIQPDSADAFLKEIMLNGQIFENVMRFCFTTNNSPDLDKVFIAENQGFVMITYSNGDTLVRK